MVNLLHAHVQEVHQTRSKDYFLVLDQPHENPTPELGNTSKRLVAIRRKRKDYSEKRREP